MALSTLKSNSWQTSGPKTDFTQYLELCEIFNSSCGNYDPHMNFTLCQEPPESIQQFLGAPIPLHSTSEII